MNQLRGIAAAAIKRFATFANIPAQLSFPAIRLVSEPMIAESADEAVSRATVEARLASLVIGRTPLVDGPVLVDAMWRNPGYWLRASIIRAALGTAKAGETAVFGRFRSIEQAASAKAMGIERGIHLPLLAGSPRAHLAAAKALKRRTRRAEDIFDWKLPGDIPPAVVYDALLKRRRVAIVDPDAPHFIPDVAEILGEIEAARRVVDATNPKLIIASHVIDASFGALAWISLSRGVEVVLAFGNYGVPRYYRMRRPNDIFRTADQPDRSALDSISPAKIDRLAEVGLRQVERRMIGATNDLGARYAYDPSSSAPSKKDILKLFGWRDDRPIVAVYAANWFDYPHSFGMRRFRDYLDWLMTTLNAARSNDSVNWLFRPHPCDTWYGGITLSDLIADHAMPVHIKVSPRNWHGRAIFDAVDALVTVMGTSAIEFASLGKPVLLADDGWYSASEIGLVSPTRTDYITNLGSNWWARWDREASMRRARVLSGVYFGVPAAPAYFVAPDDTNQSKLYGWQASVLVDPVDPVGNEIQAVKDWWRSGESAYHAYKMLAASDWRTSNVGT